MSSKLAEELPDKYAIVLVGVSDSIVRTLPKQIVSIPCTQSPKELAEIYSAADLFVNPTLEDNFPTVNLEALACGTPVITYQTGGSPESLTEDCGRVVPYNNYVALRNAILSLNDSKPSLMKACVERAQLYSREDAYVKYLLLYHNKLKEM